jgi:predicted phosphoribosyltransferase
MNNLIFENRKEAGMLLARKLEKYRSPETVVLAIPRGGIPVGFEIAKYLAVPLDIILSKKIGHPQNPEFAIGAVSSTDVVVDKYLDITDDYIEEETFRIRNELKQKEEFYREVRPNVDLKDKTVIVTDDGIATGNTMMVITQLLRKSGVKKIVLAIPVLPLDRVDSVAEAVDELIYVFAPKFFPGVGMFYEDFNQVSDTEAKRLLKEINSENKIKS